MLQRLRFFLRPESATDEQLLVTIRAMLNSWNADAPGQSIHLSAYDEDRFTRQAYADLLCTMVPAFAEWAHGSSSLSSAEGEGSEQRTKRDVCVDLYDWDVWQDWWWTHTEECFPALAESDGLYMSYDPRECCVTYLWRRMFFLSIVLH